MTALIVIILIVAGQLLSRAGLRPWGWLCWFSALVCVSPALAERLASLVGQGLASSLGATIVAIVIAVMAVKLMIDWMISRS